MTRFHMLSALALIFASPTQLQSQNVETPLECSVALQISDVRVMLSQTDLFLSLELGFLEDAVPAAFFENIQNIERERQRLTEASNLLTAAFEDLRTLCTSALNR